MLKRVTKSKDVDTPSDNIIVFNRIHILPSKFHMLSESEAMNMNLCCSAQYVGFRAELFLFP